MCEPVSLGIMTGLAVTGAVIGTVETLNKSSFEASVARMNAKFAEQQATAEVQAGDVNAQVAQVKASQFAASQKSQYAESGVSVTSGGALDVLADTRIMSSQDVSTIKSNASRQAYGYQAQAASDEALASEYETFGKWDTAKTLIGGAGSAIGYGTRSYSSWKANGGNLFPAGGKS